ncbi:MAG: hypothetical protein AAGJ19_08830 [Myxococcota bacterium]
MCEQGDVLVILFRQAFGPAEPIPLSALKQASLLRAWPQSIVSLSGERVSWLRTELNQPS